MSCVLCKTIEEKFRLIKETKHSFCIVAKYPIKEGHVLIMPKRHVTQNKFSDLTPEESSDLFGLIEFMQNKMNKFSDEDVILYKNSESHSTEGHLHFHLLPSKGHMREMFASYENTPIREDISKEKYVEMKESILSVN